MHCSTFNTNCYVSLGVLFVGEEFPHCVHRLKSLHTFSHLLLQSEQQKHEIPKHTCRNMNSEVQRCFGSLAKLSCVNLRRENRSIWWVAHDKEGENTTAEISGCMQNKARSLSLRELALLPDEFEQLWACRPRLWCRNQFLWPADMIPTGYSPFTVHPKENDVFVTTFWQPGKKPRTERSGN